MAKQEQNSSETTTTTMFTIGYALAPKKVSSVIQPSLISHAKSHGINLIPIDPNKPLITTHQPLDCIVHKIYGHDWNQNLAEFSAKYPDIPVIDRPQAIERLRNRVSMLQVLDDDDLNNRIDGCDGITFGIPKQVVAYEHDSLRDHGLKFPLVAKPLLANGKDESHDMALVYNAHGSIGLKPPLVLQEFVNHGGVIFKVYVAGKHVKCVKRRSLPDISDDSLTTPLSGMIPFSQISTPISPKQQQRQKHDDNDNIVAVVTDQDVIDNAEMPPLDFVHNIANGLREGLGLNLFNFDMIRDSNDHNRYLVIDINYFPGYAKVPSYEAMLTDFFLDVVRSNQKA